MAEKNTHSILETIKKKLNKFDSKVEKPSKISDAAAEFEYITPPTKPLAPTSDMEKFLDDEPAANNKKVLNASDDFNLDDFKEKLPEAKAPTPPALPETASLEMEMAQPNISAATAPLKENIAVEQTAEAAAAFDEDDIEDYEDEVEFDEDDGEGEIEEIDEAAPAEAEPAAQNNDELTLDADDELTFEDEEEENPDLLNLEADNQMSTALPPELPQLQEEAEVAPLEQTTAPASVVDVAPQNDDLDFSDILDLEQEEVARQKVETVPDTQSHAQKDDYDIELAELDKELAKQEEELLQHPAEEKKPSAHDDIDLEFEQEIFADVKKPAVAEKIVEEIKTAPKAVPTPVVPEQKIEHDDLDFEMSETTEQQNTIQPFDMTKNNKVESRILSDNTIMQTSDSIRKLVDAKNVVAGISNFSQSPALAELATHLLEPKLEKWLNEHLGELVEKIVREEIKKIIPKE